MPDNLIKNFKVSVPPQMKSVRSATVEVVLLVLVSGLFFWFLLWPKKAELDKTREDLSAAQTQQQKVSGQLASLQSLLKQLPSAAKQSAVLDQALPLDGKTLHLQILIDALAKSSGVTASNITVNGKGGVVISGDKQLLSNPYAAKRSLQNLTATASVTGNFDQLLAFLKKIENSGRIMDVTAVSMDSSPDGGLSMKVDLKAYFLGP